MADAYEKYIASPPKKCVVCAGEFVNGQDAITKEFTGEYYSFCSPACITEFEGNPEKYTRADEDEENRE